MWASSVGKQTHACPKPLAMKTDGTNMMPVWGWLPVAPLGFEHGCYLLLKYGESWYLKKLWSSQKKWEENNETGDL